MSSTTEATIQRDNDNKGKETREIRKDKDKREERSWSVSIIAATLKNDNHPHRIHPRVWLLESAWAPLSFQNFCSDWFCVAYLAE